MRQIVLDTETTGIDPAEGHRIIEIGCVELMERQLTGRNYHVYINPDREVEAEAITVHGITNEFLADKPRFAEIADEFFEFIKLLLIGYRLGLLGLRFCQAAAARCLSAGQAALE